MRKFLSVFVLCGSVAACAQAGSQLQRRANESATAKNDDPVAMLTLPAGTKIPLVLKHAISTKSARENDNVYAETNFPVVLDGKMVVPPGTYVQGVITRIQRPGKVKGRGELLVHFNSMIFPSGYTVLLPGAVDNVPGAEHSQIAGQEGTIQADGSKGKDTGTVAGTAATGTLIGASATRSLKGAGVGGLAGAAVGLGTVLLTRGPDVRLESGTTVEMVLERPITVDRNRIGAR
ncbi:MAG TPA: hypothetical protein VN622_14310 [Clostridia bacterium]|nr:hypothetical protein [Clostridia bacterium]